MRLAVASNKFQAGTEKLIGRYFPDIRFDVVLGQRPDVPLKPDPAVVGEILTATGVAAGEQHELVECFVVCANAPTQATFAGEGAFGECFQGGVV